MKKDYRGVKSLRRKLKSIIDACKGSARFAYIFLLVLCLFINLVYYMAMFMAKGTKAFDWSTLEWIYVIGCYSLLAVIFVYLEITLRQLEKANKKAP